MWTQKLAVLIGVLALVSAGQAMNLDASVVGEWKAWKTEHNKVYKSSAEEAQRFAVWQDNRAHVNAHNAKYQAGEATFTMELNAFGDIARDEFKRLRGTRSVRKARRARNSTISRAELMDKLGRRTLPKDIDWRDHGVVNPVKNQGRCGSCYAFSTIAGIESHYALKTGMLMSLSEQQIVDCALDEGDDACGGGLMDYSFDYLLIAGVATERAYPYKAKKGVCRDHFVDEVIWLHGYLDLPEGDEYAIQLTVGLLGPTSVAIDAENEFQFYKNGIFTTEHCSSSANLLDHAVIIVGYGTDKDTGRDYWLVRNSWGPSWGEGGYIRMARSKPSNICGILDLASIPRL